MPKSLTSLWSYLLNFSTINPKPDVFVMERGIFQAAFRFPRARGSGSQLQHKQDVQHFEVVSGDIFLVL